MNRHGARTLPRPKSAAPARSRFRADIQGLRGVAVAMVLIYHSGAPFLPGGFVGVDVFFVISGFLITAALLREAESDGRISLAGFYARRARRILPAAAVVLVATAALSLAILPRTRWEETGWQIIGSALSVVNWIFAADSVDYLAGDSADSPVQHFWTLSVEEQFYLLWPLVLVLVIVCTRQRTLFTGTRRADLFNSASRKRWILVSILALSLLSLAWSVYYTQVASGPAYFTTTTRLWELGIGAIVAVCSESLRRIPAGWARLLGALGLVAIILSGVAYSASTPFPGAAALLPTLGAAAIIVAGLQPSRVGVGTILAWRPLTWIGDISYSLYLWHWPLLTFAGILIADLSVPVGLVVVALSVLPAFYTYKWIEQPVLRYQVPAPTEQNRFALGIGTVLVLVGVVAGQSVMLAPKPADAPAAAVPFDYEASAVVEVARGAELLAADPTLGVPTDTVERFSPSVVDASGDNPSVYADGCHMSQVQTDAVGCDYGALDSDFTVALVGDSHAAQWAPALQHIAKDEGWKLTTFSKSACPLSTATIVDATTGAPYTECDDWNAAVMARLTGSDRPDLVVTSSMVQPTVVQGRPSTSANSHAAFAAGRKAAWRALNDADVPVVALVDTPSMGIHVPDCIAANTTSLTECAVDRTIALDREGEATLAAASGLPGVDVVNMNDMICPASRCAPVIGNVLVYRDDDHLTATYVTTMKDVLLDRLVATGRLSTGAATL